MIDEELKDLILNDSNAITTIEYIDLQTEEVFFYTGEKKITIVSQYGIYTKEYEYVPAYNNSGVLAGYSCSEHIETVTKI